MSNEALAEECDMERAGGNDMEGAGGASLVQRVASQSR